MKKHKFFFIILFVMFGSSSLADKPSLVEQKQLVGCEKLDSGFESQGKALLNLKEFESKILIARRIYQMVEDSDTKSRAYIETSLLKNSQKAKIRCASGVINSGVRFSAVMPLIIDLSSTEKIGNTYWQLQIFKNSQGLFTWNQKSLSSKGPVIEFLTNEFDSFQFNEIQENFLQLEVVKKTKNLKETIYVEYDVIQP